MNRTHNNGNKQVDAARTPRYEPHPLVDSRVFAFYDFRAIASGFCWHYHQELELICWYTARGLRLAGDCIENFAHGDVCLIGSHLPHSWAVDVRPDRPERNIQVQFLPDCLGREVMGLADMRPLCQLFERARLGLSISGATRAAVADTLLRIATDRPSPARRFCMILTLLVDLAESQELRTLASSIAVPCVNARVDKAISRVLKFVEDHIDGDASQAKAAALLGMSPAAFSRFFKRYVGKTYIGCLNEMRIGRACTSLLKTDQSVASIAYDAGFQNLSHFNAQFRRYKRMPPLQYRRLLQKPFAERASRAALPEAGRCAVAAARR